MALQEPADFPRTALCGGLPRAVPSVAPLCVLRGSCPCVCVLCVFVCCVSFDVCVCVYVCWFACRALCIVFCVVSQTILATQSDLFF